MVAKLALTLAAVLVAATPVAIAAQNHDAAPTVPAPAAPTVAPAAIPMIASTPDAIDLALAKKVTFQFENQRLGDVLAYLSQFDPALVFTFADRSRIAGAADTAITLKVKDMAISDALSWIFELANLHQSRRQSYILVSSLVVPPASPVDALPRAVRDRLGATSSVEFVDTTLADAVAVIHRSTDVNIIIEPAVASVAVTFAAKNQSQATVLGMLCDTAGVTVVWRDGALFITDPSQVTSP